MLSAKHYFYPPTLWLLAGQASFSQARGGRSPYQRDPAIGLDSHLMDSLLCLFWGIVCVPQELRHSPFPSLSPPPPPCGGIRGSPGGEPDGAEPGWGEFRELGSGRLRLQPPGLFLSVRGGKRKSRLSVFVGFAKTPLCFSDTHVQVCEACIFLVTHTHTHMPKREYPPGQQIFEAQTCDKKERRDGAMLKIRDHRRQERQNEWGRGQSVGEGGRHMMERINEFADAVT